MKKVLAAVIAIYICSLLTSCAQAMPNYENFVSSDNSPIQQDISGTDNSTNNVPMPVTPDISSEITTDDLTVNYMGLGHVTFRVSGIELTNIPPERNNQNDDIEKNYLLISFEIENIDVSPEEEMAKNGLANCFRIYPNDSAEIADPNILWISEPDYFSDVRESSDEKSYFRFSLPDIGDTKSFILGWTLDNFGIQLLKHNKLCLTCTFAENLSMPVLYNTTPNIEG